MKILRVAQKLYPEHKGGGAYHVHAMSRDQAAMGHDVTVLTVDAEGNRPHVEERDGYTVVRYPVTMNALGNDISLGVASYLRSVDDFDVIHAHSHLYFSTNLAALKRALGGPPLAITNHGLYSQSAPEWLFRLYLRSAGRWTFNQADVVFCYTKEEENRLRQHGVSSPTEVIRNGIDTDRFTPNGPIHNSFEGEPNILFVGRLVKGKRPEDALMAFARLQRTFPDAKLTFCGNGPLYQQLEEAVCSRCLTDSVQFLGHLPYDEMPMVYRGADALLLPSRAEGFPRTVLEAMASDVPVVVSNLAGLRQTVADAGEIVFTGDVEGFTAALERVLQFPEHYTPLGNIDETYSWETTVAETTDVLTNL